MIEKRWLPHLLRRAGFGCTPAELEHYRTLGYDRSVDELLASESVDNSRLDELVNLQSFDFTNADDLKRWWLYRMTFSRRPLEEKMTLFWHGHFATSDRKVRNPYAMYLQNLLFRKYGLGSFDTLLMKVSMDPAMIVWLDNQQNRKNKPNENFAREIMELFTMGIGNYSETDIKEAARAFTGWQTRPNGFFFNRNQHDFGSKTVLGTTGNFNGDDVVRALADKPATARFLAAKLIRFFAFDDAEKAFVDRVADAYITHKHQIKPMLRTIFADPSFRSNKAYHAKIKSPAELVVGTLKVLQIKQMDGDLPDLMAAMGQDLFAPPSVKGWDGGPAWISSDTMMERFNFAARVASAKFDELQNYFTPAELAAKHGLKNSGQMVDYLLDLLVDGDVPYSTRQRLVQYASTDFQGKRTAAIKDERTLDAKLRGLVHLIMTLPTYQLC